MWFNANFHFESCSVLLPITYQWWRVIMTIKTNWSDPLWERPTHTKFYYALWKCNPRSLVYIAHVRIYSTLAVVTDSRMVVSRIRPKGSYKIYCYNCFQSDSGNRIFINFMYYTIATCFYWENHKVSLSVPRRSGLPYFPDRKCSICFITSNFEVV